MSESRSGEPEAVVEATGPGQFVWKRHHQARGARATVMCLRCCRRLEIGDPTQERADEIEAAHRCGPGSGWHGD